MSILKKANKENGVYVNPVPTRQLTESMASLLWKTITSKAERVPANPLPLFYTDPTVYMTPPASGLRITWMGHSSLLIEMDGMRILTDPVWGDRASFLSWAGPKRFFPAPLALDQLPPLDLILLSHDHYDHLDKPTIKKLTNGDTPIICSMGVGGIISKWGIARKRITEVDWMDTVPVGGLQLTAVPSRHFSGRGITNRNRTLWSAFVVKGPQHKIFFGADSGWFDGFREIGDTFGPFDLTTLEIGAYGDGWPDIHMGPDNASEAHLGLKGSIMMPIHWGTFNLALHPWREPVERILDISERKNIQLFLPRPGIPTEVAAGHISRWWE
jgi:L-ascorbate metabolism protein UlaG (beta-lactamase superfamily)